MGHYDECYERDADLARDAKTIRIRSELASGRVLIPHEVKRALETLKRQDTIEPRDVEVLFSFLKDPARYPSL